MLKHGIRSSSNFVDLHWDWSTTLAYTSKAWWTWKVWCNFLESVRGHYHRFHPGYAPADSQGIRIGYVKTSLHVLLRESFGEIRMSVNLASTHVVYVHCAQTDISLNYYWGHVVEWFTAVKLQTKCINCGIHILSKALETIECVYFWIWRFVIGRCLYTRCRHCPWRHKSIIPSWIAY